jgi:hypothetical protein
LAGQLGRFAPSLSVAHVSALSPKSSTIGEWRGKALAPGRMCASGAANDPRNGKIAVGTIETPDTVGRLPAASRRPSPGPGWRP